MMRHKQIFLSLFASLFLIFSSVSIAEESSYGEKIGQKTLRGLSNATLGILEIPKGIIKTTNDTNAIYGLTAGAFLGLINTLGRTSVGTLDLITFPLPTKPVVQPVHPWQSYLTLPTNYDAIFDLDLLY